MDTFFRQIENHSLLSRNDLCIIIFPDDVLKRTLSAYQFRLTNTYLVDMITILLSVCFIRLCGRSSVICLIAIILFKSAYILDCDTSLNSLDGAGVLPVCRFAT